MSGNLPSTAPGTVCNEDLHQWKGQTIMVIGGPGTGKTTLARDLAQRLAGEAGLIGLLSADMGQPAVGVPTCLALALTHAPDRPTALWFVGDVSPGGNLLPTVVGTARLAERARAEGAQTVIIDTTGLVDGGLGRVLKYHKALAAGVDRVVAIQRSAELEELLALLGGICPRILRLAPTPQAANRSPAERKAHREERYRGYFHGGAVFSFEPRSVVGLDWASSSLEGPGSPARGTVVGLLERMGFCLGLGIIEQIEPDRLRVYTPCREPQAVVRVQLGRVCLDRHAGFAETH